MQGECVCGGGTPTNMYIGRQFHTGQMHGKHPKMSNAKTSNRVLIRTVPGEST